MYVYLMLLVCVCIWLDVFGFFIYFRWRRLLSIAHIQSRSSSYRSAHQIESNTQMWTKSKSVSKHPNIGSMFTQQIEDIKQDFDWVFPTQNRFNLNKFIAVFLLLILSTLPCTAHSAHTQKRNNKLNHHLERFRSTYSS